MAEIENKRKSVYNAEVQLKYRQKRKKLAVDLPVEDAEKVINHYTQKGYTSANSYILSLIRADMGIEEPTEQ